MTITVLSSLDPRIPSWNKEDMVEIPCPVCECDNASSIATRADGLVVNKCRRCGLLYVSPRPSDSALKEFYARYSETHQRVNYQDDNYWFEIYLSRYGFLKGNPRMYFLKHMNIDVKGKRILDVGCGNSGFLFLCKNHGAGHVVGIEPDKRMAEAATNRLGLNVYAGYIDDLPEDERQFDLVVLWDVLEHIAFPRELLTRIREVLAPDGCVAATSPNADSVKREGIQWTGFKVDFDHICYYGRDSARYLLESCGFHLEAIVPFAWPCSYSKSCNNKKSRRRVIRGFVAASKVPLIEVILGRLASITGVLENVGRNSQGEYVLYMLARKK